MSAEHRFRPSPVTVRGRRFATAAAAGRAFGVTRTTIYGWIAAERRGDTLPPVRPVACEARMGPVPRPVALDGKTFASARAAAQHFGVTRDTIYRWLAAARKDGRVPAVPQNAKAVPVQIGPLSFPSKRQAEITLGLSPGALQRAPGPQLQQDILAAAWRCLLEMERAT